MTREEIINQGRPTEPNCFETDRDEQWYNLGLYDGATANPWHSIADGDEPLSYVDCLFSYGEGLIDKGFMSDNRYVHLDGEFSPMLDIEDVKFWMEIPSIPEKEK